MKNNIQFLLVLLLLTASVKAQNYALKFDDENDYVSVNSNFGLGTNNVTVECWVYLPSSSEKGTFVNIGGNGEGYGIGVGSGSFDISGNELIVINDLVGWHPTGANIGTGWHHVAFTIDGSANTVVYLDGNSVLTYTETPRAPLNITYIGSTLSNNRLLTNGKIDEVRIWNTARTDAQIKQNMYKELAGTEGDLVAYYKMSDGSGTSLTDNLSAGGTNGTMTGASWQTSGALAGPRMAMNFDGTDDYVSLDAGLSFNNATAVTIEGWIFPRSFNPASPDDNISNIAGYDNASILVRIGDAMIENNQLQFILFATDRLNSNTRLQVDTWYHFAAVFDGTTAYLYINGVLDNSMTSTSGLFTTSTLFRLGGTLSAASRMFDGVMDEIRIWSDARTESEIRENMSKSLTGNEDGLLAYYRADYVDGTVLYDNDNAAAYNGTMNGNIGWVSSSAFNTWIGAESSSWSTVANWSRNSAPASPESVGIFSYTGGNNCNSTASATVNNLYVNSTDALNLSAGITVGGNMLLKTNVGLNGQAVALGTKGKLVEDGGLLLGTSGSITATRDLNNISAENVAGLGALITTAGNMGTTTITRSHSTGGSPTSINRSYQISPANNSGLEATLVFTYNPDELNGQTESGLKLYKSANGKQWHYQDNASLNTVNNTLTLTGINDFSYWTASSESFYLTGNCLDFDGTDDYVDFSSAPSTVKTLEFWVYPNGDTQKILQLNGTTSVEINSGTVTVLGFTNPTIYVNGVKQSTVTNGIWNHIALTTATAIDASSFELGRVGSDYFTGKMDELRVWSAVRTLTEVQDHMCASVTGNETNLLAYYPFNSSSGSSLYDRSGNGFTGTLHNFVDLDWEASSAFNTWLNTGSDEWWTASNWSLNTVPENTSNVGVYAGATAPYFFHQPGTTQVHHFVLGTGASTKAYASATIAGSDGNFINNGSFNANITRFHMEENNAIQYLAGNQTTSISEFHIGWGESGSGSNTSVILSPEARLTVSGDFYVAELSTLTLQSDASSTASFKVDGSITNSGTMAAQLYIGGWSDANHGWHFLSSPVAAQAISDFHTAGSGNDFYKWNEPTNNWINRTASGGALNESFETSFTVGKAYLIANSTSTTKTFTGNLNNATVSVTGLSKTDAIDYSGWHLLGNPYACALQWGLGSWNLSDVDDNCQIWNEANASYSVISSGNDIIPAMNGFMVHASVNNASLSIPTDARVHHNTNWYKAGDAYDNGIVLKAVDPQGQTAQQTIIRFDNDATAAYDSHLDSYFLAGFAPLFYSNSMNENYALNTLPQLNESLQIPLGFVKNASDNFLIEVEVNNSGMTLFLTDHLTNFTTTLSSQQPYAFSAQPGDRYDRFTLHFSPLGIENIGSSAPLYRAWAAKNKLFLAGPASRLEVCLVDLQGRKLWQQTIMLEDILQLPLQAPAGMYLLQIRAEDRFEAVKILKTN